MSARRARIYLPPGMVGGSVEVDGVEIPGIRGLTIHGRIEHLTHLTLDVLVHEAEIDGEAIITVPEKTRDALVALGWIPPVEPALGEPAERDRRAHHHERDGVPHGSD